jgi:hypothetical protein
VFHAVAPESFVVDDKENDMLYYNAEKAESQPHFSKKTKFPKKSRKVRNNPAFLNAPDTSGIADAFSLHFPPCRSRPAVKKNVRA